MKVKAGRIKNLTETFAALLEQEQRACREIISSLIEGNAAPIDEAHKDADRVSSQTVREGVVG